MNANGTNAVSVTATGSNGTSQPTIQSLVIDTTAPAVSMAAGSITTAGAVNVTSTEAGTLYLVNSNVSVTNVASITGAGAGQFVSAASNAGQATSVSATGLAAGTYHAYAVDSAGNLSLVSTNAVSVVVGSGATVATVAFSADTGSSSSDFITNTSSQTISGTLSANVAANEIVQVSLDNGSTWTTAATQTGSNTFSLSNADISANGADNANTLKVRVVDALNASSAVHSQSFIYDATPVDRPDIELAIDNVGSVVGTIATLNNLSATPGNTAVTYDSAPGIRVSFRAGAGLGDIIKVYDGGSNNPIV